MLEVRPLILLFKTLADESRLKTLWMLEERELCVCEIQEALGLAQSTVSRHLMLLEEAGFVVSEKAGPWKNFQLNPSPSPATQGLLAVVRLAAQTEPEALALRERVRTICRENLCCPKVA
jgi:ArsR family transcriptional regulator